MLSFTSEADITPTLPFRHGYESLHSIVFWGHPTDVFWKKNGSFSPFHPLPSTPASAHVCLVYWSGALFRRLRSKIPKRDSFYLLKECWQRR
ncbi:hypothetical protein CDAR_573091 [Caerostris darwini]|uniref:Uncharacterized protein n=1 Tax=Caerostris darwini TaxID=1538125 RepID=A0AAV4W7U1_9ARAC|nr:hypothetical protein CDAR_573091 [Caerostris darwini]